MYTDFIATTGNCERCGEVDVTVIQSVNYPNLCDSCLQKAVKALREVDAVKDREWAL